MVITKHGLFSEERLEPDPETVKKYDEKYREFKRIYPALRDLFAGGTV